MTYSALANPRVTKQVLQDFGLSAKHSLGQNFLIDDNVIANILRFSNLKEPQPGSSLPCVLEIGPGIGTLTVALLEYASVIAIEKDHDLVDVLAQTTADLSHRFVLLQKDALKLTIKDILSAAETLATPAVMPQQLIANLPYGIAATVVLDWFERFEFIEAMTVMVQSEVADRMCAQVGTKEYGAYTIKLALYADVIDRFQVPASCFMPAPHIESAVVRIIKKPATANLQLLSVASKLADAAFAQRRKTIRNSMQSKFPRDMVDKLLAACDIEPTVRGETLTPSQYLQMAQTYLDLQSP